MSHVKILIRSHFKSESKQGRHPVHLPSPNSQLQTTNPNLSYHMPPLLQFYGTLVTEVVTDTDSSPNKL